MTATRDAAIRYAEHGWRVFPVHAPDEHGVCSCRDGADCDDIGKHPRIRRWQEQATADTGQVAAWWDRWPDANIGLATGRGSGVVAVDVDKQDGLRELIDRYGKLPETAAFKTGRGGQMLFAAPEDSLPRSNTRSLLADGIDTRDDGGYSLLPPSRHENGRQYEWVSKKRPAPLPQPIVDALGERKPAEDEPADDGTTTPYGRTVLDGESAKLLRVKEGSRNGALFTSAVRIAELAKADHIDWQHGREVLLKAASPWQHETPPVTREEAEKVLESAWQRAEANPPDEQERPDGPAVEPSGKADFLTLDDLRDLPPPRWLVPQVMPEGLTVLYGARGSGKTFTALDWTLTLASEGYTVVYCAGEGVSGLASRIDSWVRRHPDRDPGGRFNALARGAFPRLLSEQSVHRLQSNMQKLADRGTPADLFVVDTWARSLVGGSDSSDESANLAVAVLDDLRNRYGTSSLVLHHPRKPGKDDRDPPERGSGVLVDSADFAWKCHAYDTSEDRRLENVKAKEWDLVGDLRFTLQKEGRSLVTSPSVVDLMGGHDGG